MKPPLRISIAGIVSDWLEQNEGQALQDVEFPAIPGFRFEGFSEGGKKYRPLTLSRNLTVILRRLT